jgi:hypothetical protein
MKYFLAYWCSEGLESITDITKYKNWKQQQLVDIIAGKKKTPNPLDKMLFYMEMRARYNPQRYYELYAFNTDLDEEDIKRGFEDDPQMMADLIRKIGTKVFSHRKHSKTVIE